MVHLLAHSPAAQLSHTYASWTEANAALSDWMRHGVAPTLPDTDDGRHVADLMLAGSPFAAEAMIEHGFGSFTMSELT